MPLLRAIEGADSHSFAAFCNEKVVRRFMGSLPFCWIAFCIFSLPRPCWLCRGVGGEGSVNPRAQRLLFPHPQSLHLTEINNFNFNFTFQKQ